MNEPEIVHVGRRDCPTCGQIEVADSSGNILDHNQPDGRECSVSDIDWNGAIALHPVAPVERRSYVSKERAEAAERECVQLRAELGHAAEMLYVICEYASVDTKTLLGDDLSARPDIHRMASDLIDRISASGLLDDEGQQR